MLQVKVFKFCLIHRHGCCLTSSQEDLAPKGFFTYFDSLSTQIRIKNVFWSYILKCQQLLAFKIYEQNKLLAF